MVHLLGVAPDHAELTARVASAGARSITARSSPASERFEVNCARDRPVAMTAVWNWRAVATTKAPTAWAEELAVRQPGAFDQSAPLFRVAALGMELLCRLMHVRFGLSGAAFRGLGTGQAPRERGASGPVNRESWGLLTECVLVGLFILVGCGGQQVTTDHDVPGGSAGGDDSLSGGAASAPHDGEAGSRADEAGSAGHSNGGDVSAIGPWIDERYLAEVSEASGRYYMVSQRGEHMLIDGNVELSFGATPGYFSWHLCNEHLGDYEILEGRLVPGSIEKTQADCGLEKGSWEDWVEQFFMAEPMIRAHGDDLVLMSEGTQLVFAPGRGPRPQLLPTAPLEGTVWTVTDLAANPDGRVHAYHYYMPNPDFLGSIVFDDQETVTVTGPCNVGTGRYSIVETTEKTLIIEEMGWTKTACADPDASHREELLAQVFEGEPLQYGIYDQSLMISSTNFPPAGAVVSHHVRARADLE